MRPPEGASAPELARGIADGRWTSGAVVEGFLGRIAARNPGLGALTEVWADEARSRGTSTGPATRRPTAFRPWPGPWRPSTPPRWPDSGPPWPSPWATPTSPTSA